ncbi:decarboxylating cobalt-precorrin-6B (C(15))-methyltransferase [Paenibacillus thiaminolyticus]|uniref:decarboxylating cobalt-precorrin-6B (C(15))-methyltransferase n=1 Tax=Paenibacillus thiaminolyticus TaxID=49283 RepID=UPI00234FBE8D|nr:decarboxylating cobalt-precorrin-6B (C(15))-methyltransferase [Paenibacillus thiaminolyticus]WCR27442.1 decarboxylating cobalt-precorrin-6B (C(15))-methyltransferase [Paenibacillus thiaminolyticus]
MKDEAFIRGKTPMTKAEVRAVSIDKLALDETSRRVLDVGAGTGSVALQVAKMFPHVAVTAIERNEEALALIEQNRRQFGLDNVEIVAAEAPVRLDNTVFDAIFVGGSGGQLTEIIDWSYALLNPGGQLVLNFILMENALEAAAYLEQGPWQEVEIIQMQVSKWQELGQGHYFKPQNPTFIIACQKERSGTA